MKNKWLVIAFISTTAFYSCVTYRYIYTASPPNNPYFTKKNESKLSASYSASSNGHAGEVYAGGLDMQGAYAIANHWAIAATYFNSREKDTYNSGSDGPFDNSAVKYKRNLVEISAGYFAPLSESKTVTFNLYAGLGLGKFLIDDNGEIFTGVNYNRYHKANITKYFLQPAFNFRPLKNFRLSLILNNSFVHYGNIKTSYNETELQYFMLDKLTNKTIFFLEPAINLQLGLNRYPWLKVDWTIAGISNSANTEFNVRQNNVSIGLSFDFSKMVKKIKD
ncbi:MAG: hypothetical protein M3015_03560 [Bacteroidota bacterium]|nr:hypothetical protein [Bacteroidota bacterium]